MTSQSKRFWLCRPTDMPGMSLSLCMALNWRERRRAALLLLLVEGEAIVVVVLSAENGEDVRVGWRSGGYALVLEKGCVLRCDTREVCSCVVVSSKKEKDVVEVNRCLR